MIGRRWFLAAGAVCAFPVLATQRRAKATVSICVDLSETWLNPQTKVRSRRLLSTLGSAIVGAAKILPRPLMVRYHAIGLNSLGQEPICEAFYRKSLFSMRGDPGEITDEAQFTNVVTSECPQLIVSQRNQMATEITAAIISAMRATAMAEPGIPKILIILSDFKEESAARYSLSSVDLRGVKAILIYRILQEDRRNPAGLETRMAIWAKALSARGAIVRSFEESAVSASDLQAIIEGRA